MITLGFNVKISSNLKIANFLDITFDLNNNSYKTFNKNNDIPAYINVNSWCIIKQISTAVNLRINWLSSSKTICVYNKGLFNEVLHNSGFNKKLEFLDLNRTNEYRNNNTKHNKHRINDTNNNNDHLGNSNYNLKKRHWKMIWVNSLICKYIY